MMLRIEALGQRHRPLLSSFENQHPSLTEYLRRYAWRHQQKDLLARTFLAVDEVDASERIAGYFTLTTTFVERISASDIESLRRLPRFPIPGVLLARLAVDHRAQGQGVGRYLLRDALGRTIDLTQSGPVTFRLLVTDAIDQAAASFYEHHGFAPLQSTSPRRLVLDLKPLTDSG
ncbi:MAG: GNAT family N-acetyltransferase [Nannocystaceae bacterium]